jgi:hypothetical protein
MMCGIQRRAGGAKQTNAERFNQKPRQSPLALPPHQLLPFPSPHTAMQAAQVGPRRAWGQQVAASPPISQAHQWQLPHPPKKKCDGADGKRVNPRPDAEAEGGGQNAAERTEGCWDGAPLPAPDPCVPPCAPPCSSSYPMLRPSPKPNPRPVRLSPAAARGPGAAAPSPAPAPPPRSATTVPRPLLPLPCWWCALC